MTWNKEYQLTKPTSLASDDMFSFSNETWRDVKYFLLIFPPSSLSISLVFPYHFVKSSKQCWLLSIRRFSSKQKWTSHFGNASFYYFAFLASHFLLVHQKPLEQLLIMVGYGLIPFLRHSRNKEKVPTCFSAILINFLDFNIRTNMFPLISTFKKSLVWDDSHSDFPLESIQIQL